MATFDGADIISVARLEGALREHTKGAYVKRPTDLAVNGGQVKKKITGKTRKKGEADPAMPSSGRSIQHSLVVNR
ncbi:MAG: hypothetical protein ACREBC_26415 [Pyrinomonadaceae bacterium]